MGGGLTNQPDATLAIPFTIGGSGCCDSLVEDMVIGIESPDCQEIGCGVLFIGANSLGQIAPTYIAAPDCGIVDPVDLALIGFPNAHIVYVVTVNESFPPVPATSAVGMALMVLLLIASSAYYMRRRVSN